ncbi:unnamed protein product [Clonostachys chloroleuca]|uniref:Major facilitator superfamily (MFS) profile domain-containing protein n=1 Tax=Clonostachys chloroleuca TaxID=1926264 RepID=A0AA35Q5K4_9HYPO|nr:unnamed protein product [Clonostachys chloroleuca]
MSTRNASDTRGLTWYNFLAVSCFSMGAIFWGYDIGILSTVLVAPGYLTALKNPSSGESGLIVAIFSVGSWLSYAFVAGQVNDRLGRRWSGVTGVAVLCVGAGLQAGAVHLAMMVIGRFIAGVGTGIVATAVPLYLSETSPARHRGAIITISIAFWIGYGFSFWRAGNGESLGWRLSIFIQYVPAVIFCVGAPFLCERFELLVLSQIVNLPPLASLLTYASSSPRWLLEHDQLEAAAKALTHLRGSDRPEVVQAELEEIRAILIKDRALWARLWRAWALQFLQQLSGAGGIRYYLPSNFRGAGASESPSLLASGIDGTVMAACTIAAILLVDRIGRRHSLGIGAAIMALSMLMNGALQTRYPNQSNVAANNCSIFFIFFFSLGYSIGFGPTAWTYAAEACSIQELIACLNDTEALTAAFDAESNFIAYCCQVHSHTYTCIKYSLKGLGNRDADKYRRTACWFKAPWKVVDATGLGDDNLLTIRRNHLLRWRSASATTTMYP